MGYCENWQELETQQYWWRLGNNQTICIGSCPKQLSQFKLPPTVSEISRYSSFFLALGYYCCTTNDINTVNKDNIILLSVAETFRSTWLATYGLRLYTNGGCQSSHQGGSRRWSMQISLLISLARVSQERWELEVLAQLWTFMSIFVAGPHARYSILIWVYYVIQHDLYFRINFPDKTFFNNLMNILSSLFPSCWPIHRLHISVTVLGSVCLFIICSTGFPSLWHQTEDSWQAPCLLCALLST